MVLCLLLASGVARVHAQTMPPAVATPTDPFHQPCVAVKAAPAANGEARSFAIFAPSAIPAIPTSNRIVRKQYVDLDDRCAPPPAFAPTRDTDSTTVWFVDAPAYPAHLAHPAHDPHAASKPSRAGTLREFAS
ncbi:hypothetical protein PAP18089_02523 [Pandoraea apista]|uniref:Uncharacterized protein n=1 Tax=Pandoraea apista TaxID=93218 RepID=A0A5E5P5B9_9BURK|nr:hypothetical protein PAP18089_02523 [Pandoraea apista]